MPTIEVPINEYIILETIAKAREVSIEELILELALLINEKLNIENDILTRLLILTDIGKKFGEFHKELKTLYNTVIQLRYAFKQQVSNVEEFSNSAILMSLLMRIDTLFVQTNLIIERLMHETDLLSMFESLKGLHDKYRDLLDQIPRKR